MKTEQKQVVHQLPFAVPLINLWPTCNIEALCYQLEDGVWTLVEFWAPDNLFSRLLAPVRVKLPHSHGAHLRLICCTLRNRDDRGRAFGAIALPALVLFHGKKRVRRWLGTIDLLLLRHDIDLALATASHSRVEVV